MKELIESYQQLLTKIEEREKYISQLMRTGGTQESIKSLRMRRDTLREEYDDIVYALRAMTKYADADSSHTVIREVNAL